MNVGQKWSRGIKSRRETWFVGPCLPGRSREAYLQIPGRCKASRRIAISRPLYTPPRFSSRLLSSRPTRVILMSSPYSTTTSSSYQDFSWDGQLPREPYVVDSMQTDFQACLLYELLLVFKLTGIYSLQATVTTLRVLNLLHRRWKKRTSVSTPLFLLPNLLRLITRLITHIIHGFLTSGMMRANFKANLDFTTAPPVTDSLVCPGRILRPHSTS